MKLSEYVYICQYSLCLLASFMELIPFIYRDNVQLPYYYKVVDKLQKILGFIHLMNEGLIISNISIRILL